MKATVRAMNDEPKMPLPIDFGACKTVDEVLAACTAHAQEVLAYLRPQYEESARLLQEDAARKAHLRTLPGYCRVCALEIGDAFRICTPCQDDNKRRAARERYAAQKALGRPVTRRNYTDALRVLNKLGKSQNMCLVVAQLFGLPWDTVFLHAAELQALDEERTKP